MVGSLVTGVDGSHENGQVGLLTMLSLLLYKVFELTDRLRAFNIMIDEPSLQEPFIDVRPAASSLAFLLWRGGGVRCQLLLLAEGTIFVAHHLHFDLFACFRFRSCQLWLFLQTVLDYQGHKPTNYDCCEEHHKQYAALQNLHLVYLCRCVGLHCQNKCESH